MTTSFWMGLSLAMLTVLISVAVILVCGRYVILKRDNAYSDTAAAKVFGGVGCFVLLAVVVGSLFAFYPYKAEYHSWRPYEGTVQQVSHRIVGGSDSVSEKFVVVFKENPQQALGINDTRASLLRKGDHVKLLCLRRHQWGGGVDGYDCRWNQ